MPNLQRMGDGELREAKRKRYHKQRELREEMLEIQQEQDRRDAERQAKAAMSPDAINAQIDAIAAAADAAGEKV